MLVLIDGRSVYTPLFSGVFWDVQDTVLEDIDRIEVVRGPGATLWGANEVNGGINIITRSAKETHGGMLSVIAGSEDRNISTLRYATAVSKNANLRTHLKYLNRDAGERSGSLPENDSWDVLRGGFRLDAAINNQNNLTLQGDLYGGDSGQTDSFATLTAPYTDAQNTNTEISGGNVLGRWTSQQSVDSKTSLQIYYDFTLRDDKGSIKEKRQTWDIEFQHNLHLASTYEFVWGGGYRLLRDELAQTQANMLFLPTRRTDHLYSLFGQFDLELIPDKLRFIFGSKFEHNDYTGFEYQPNIRAIWSVAPEHAVWAAVSRAVRTPSRVDDDGSVAYATRPPSPASMGLPTLLTANGSRASQAENLLAWEAGYRTLVNETLSFDLAVFYNQYTDNRTGEFTTPTLNPNPPVPHWLLEGVVDNKAEVDTKGFEISADWRPRDWCRLIAAYSYLDIDVDLEAGSNDPSSKNFTENYSPQNQLSLRTQLDLPANIELDAWLRHVDELDPAYVGNYTELDIRIGYQPTADLEFSLTGQNLLNDSHLEFSPEYQLLPTKVERSVYAKLTWNF